MVPVSIGHMEFLKSKACMTNINHSVWDIIFFLVIETLTFYKMS